MRLIALLFVIALTACGDRIVESRAVGVPYWEQRTLQTMDVKPCTFTADVKIQKTMHRWKSGKVTYGEAQIEQANDSECK